MLCIEDLLMLEPFQQLPRERLEWLCDRAQTLTLKTGEVLVHEGDPHRGLFILASGQVVVTRRSEGVEIPVGRHDAPAFFGEVQVLTDERYPITLRAITDSNLYEIEGVTFVNCCTSVASLSVWCSV